MYTCSVDLAKKYYSMNGEKVRSVSNKSFKLHPNTSLVIAAKDDMKEFLGKDTQIPNAQFGDGIPQCDS